jgi:uncharacterized protein (TIGR03089 family)
MASTLPELFAAAVKRDPGRPFVTFYDDASGERIELSYATTANWVAKTANLLTDELDLATGDTVRIALPPHWLGVVWALAAWSAHATLTSTTGDIAIIGPDRLEDLEEVRGKNITVASALLPLGGRFREPLPPGVVDFGAEVYNHGDLYVLLDPPRPESPAYDDRTHADLVAAAGPIGERVLTTRDLANDPTTLAGVLAGGGSVVLCRNLDPATLDRRVADERVDTVLDRP